MLNASDKAYRKMLIGKAFREGTLKKCRYRAVLSFKGNYIYVFLWVGSGETGLLAS
jgi:hypothetical protein